MRPDGGKSSILIRFQLRLGSGNTRGSVATNSPQAEAARRRKLRRSWTCQEQRSEKKLATDDRGPHAVPARRTAESRCRSGRDTGPPKHSKRLSSDDARTPVERDLVHPRHRHCGVCVVPSLLSEFSRVSTDRVSATSGIASSRPHSLASYAVENHRTAVTSGQSRALERKVSE
jgi:hypothetical protein